MNHPFETLRPEYTQLLSLMKVRAECEKAVDEVATRILSYRRNFEAVKVAIGVPVVFSGPSFEREADLNFNDSPAQGDPWRKVSVHVPRGMGPYPDWQTAAIASYSREGLNRIGDGNWTWELVCYYAELFNGFGYRDYHREHSPYLWGGTNIQQPGKYTADGKFENVKDVQLGVLPVAKRIAKIAPDLDLVISDAVIPPPVHSGLAVNPTNATHDTKWLQNSLKTLGYDVVVDGSYGRETKHFVASFQQAFGLIVDGYAGKQTLESIEHALANLESKV